MQSFQYIRRFAECGIEDVPDVGGKSASLGEMYSELSEQGVKVPNGFATTADAYRHLIESNHLGEKIAETIGALDPEDVHALAETGARIRGWILDAAIPADFEAELEAAYRELEAEYGENTDVAVRSSATAEDLPDASFAGQQETLLNIRGVEALKKAALQVFSSLFTNRAISYRAHQGFAHMEVALSLAVQKMARSDRGASGVMFTLDTETGFRDVVFITAAYGLGENVVQGAVNPDEFYVFKPTLATGHRPIVKRHLGGKQIQMVYADDGPEPVKNIDVEEARRNRYCIDDEQVLTLAKYAVLIEKHYSAKAGEPRPMDIEWALDGVTGDLFIVQARPETVQSNGAVQETFKLQRRGDVLCEGKAVGARVAHGTVRLVAGADEMSVVQPGDVLVTDMTDPDWEPVMKIASAIVTNRGGRTCHAAIIARELGIPAIVGTGDGSEALSDGAQVTISCAEGDTGYVYAGHLPFSTEKIDMASIPKPDTKIMLNLANPSIAFETSKLPNSGVGLARLEFIINTHIGIHPRALLELDSLDNDLQAVIRDRIPGHTDNGADFYVDALAEGVATIAAAFYPNPVIARLSDFKSNEYAALIGGSRFEPEEENPMLGFRGASRYPSRAFADAFALECKAMRRVRNEMGLTNLMLMIPFVRTVEEQGRVLDLLAELGLKRGDNGLKIVMMCELPANAVLADQFLENVDGFSIGSNDMTQLTLGVDRDSGMLSGYDERDPAVLAMLDMAITACKKAGKYVGICGQAPSDFPEITTWLVERGIESMSLNPDSVLEMTKVVLEVEARRKG